MDLIGYIEGMNRENRVVQFMQQVDKVPGFLTLAEGHTLFKLAETWPGEGDTIEIGSFKGKSTTGLALLSAPYNLGPLVSIDPHNAPSVTDPMLGDQHSSFDDFQSALRNAGVLNAVEAHRLSSREAALDWNRPIRFLWIDGDHTYAGENARAEILQWFNNLHPRS